MNLKSHPDRAITADNERQLLTFTAAGEIAGVSRTTIGKWVAAGELDSCPMPRSKHRRIKRRTLIEFLDRLENEG